MASRPLKSDPLAPGQRQALAVAAVCGVAAAVIALLILHSLAVAGGFAAGMLLLVGAAFVWSRFAPASTDAAGETDWSVARALAAASEDAIAVTDRAGRLICANERYRARFGGYPTPPGLPLDGSGAADLATAGRAAWRDGSADLDRVTARGSPMAVAIERAGESEDMLVWRFHQAQGLDLATNVQALIAGPTGDRLAAAGIMAALIAPDGRLLAANRVLRERSMGHEEAVVVGRDFARFLIADDKGQVRFEREGLRGAPLRILQIPFLDGEDAPILVALLDEEEHGQPAIGGSAAARRGAARPPRPGAGGRGVAPGGPPGGGAPPPSTGRPRRSIPATWWCARTRAPSPTRSAASPMARRTRWTWRSACATIPTSRSR